MPRYAPKMSQDDLRKMIVNTAIRKNYIEEYGDYDESNPDMTRIVHMLLMEELLGDVEKDWSKIDFSTENMDVTGEKVTTDGIPYLQIKAGGDWESPLVCIIYFDGKKLRGYVPKEGNSYNHQAKAAFGNNDSDAAACARQFGGSFDQEEGQFDVEPNIALIEKDIGARIEAKGDYSYTSGPIVSKDKLKAEKQAQIEKKQDLSGPITADMVYAVISLAAGGAYVEFELRSSRRKLKMEEGKRLIGVPTKLVKTIMTTDSAILWYSPMGYYPMETLALLEAAGFTKAPNNDLSAYHGARTVVIR